MRETIACKAYTDYPFRAEDKKGEAAPIRRVIVRGFDGNKYCTIEHDGTTYDNAVKIGYLFQDEALTLPIMPLIYKYTPRWLIDMYPALAYQPGAARAAQ